MAARVPVAGDDPFRKVRRGLLALTVVLAAGTVGHVGLGRSVLDALCQTVVTVTTVGTATGPAPGAAEQVFTIGLLLVGVGTALYTFSAVLEVLVEGHMRERARRRRMDRAIAAMSGHVVICGWGRVGREVAHHLAGVGRAVVVVEATSSGSRPSPTPSCVATSPRTPPCSRRGSSVPGPSWPPSTPTPTTSS